MATPLPAVGPQVTAEPDPDVPADADAVARSIALGRLSRAPQTRAQLERVLRRRQVPDEAARRVLDRFAEVGLVDDASFADAWVETRHTGRGLGRRALAHELRQRGVGDELIEAALTRLDPDTEAAGARALITARLPSTQRLDRDARIRRLVGMLARKGYSPGLALRVVREVLAGAETSAQESHGGTAVGDTDSGGCQPSP